MMTKMRILTYLVVTFVGLALAACEQRSPILVFVTPTPVPQIGAVSSPVSDAGATVQAAPSAASPTATVVPVIGGAESVEPVQPTEPPRIATAGPITPQATFLGPVIGPDYVLPPTSTPVPTSTQTPGPTATPGGPVEPTAAPPTQPIGLPTPLPNLDPSRLGIQVDWNLDQDDWEDAVGRRIEGDLQAGWVKVQIPWRDLQPTGPNDYGEVFRRVEQYLQYADREGLNILISVAKAPPWARSVHVEDGPPDDPQMLANFLTTLLSKVPFVDAVEIWNEPNLKREWQGTLPFNGAGYMQLFGPAYQAVKAVVPNARVVTAGLAPTGNSEGSRDDRQFLREMYNAGLTQYADVAIGVHPYGWGNPASATCCGTRGWDDDRRFFFRDTLADYRQIMQAHGHGNAELWPTEFGWATWQGLPGDPPQEWMAFNDRWAQANYTVEALQIGQQMPGVGPMFLWNLNFGILGNLIETRDERAAYSLLTPLQPMERPLYWMLYDAVRPEESLAEYD